MASIRRPKGLTPPVTPGSEYADLDDWLSTPLEERNRLAEELKFGQLPGDEERLAELYSAPGSQLEQIRTDRSRFLTDNPTFTGKNKEFGITDKYLKPIGKGLLDVIPGVGSNLFPRPSDATPIPDLGDLLLGHPKAHISDPPRPELPQLPKGKSPDLEPLEIPDTTVTGDMPRFMVEEGEIIDTRNRQIISPEAFEKLAKPDERAAIEAALQGAESDDYDYEAAQKAGVVPKPDLTDIDPETGEPRLHWDSRFKKDHHRNRFIPSELGIYDSKHNRLVPQEEFDRVATPDQKANVLEHPPLPRDEVQGYLGQPAPSSTRVPTLQPSMPPDLGAPFQPVPGMDGLAGKVAAAEQQQRETGAAPQPLARYGDFEPLTLGKAFQESGKSFLRGIGNTSALTLKGIGLWAKELDTLAGNEKKNDDYATYRLGDKIGKWTAKTFEGRPDLQSNFLLTTLFEGAGSSVPFLATGAAGAAVGAGPGAMAGVTGALAGGAGLVERAPQNTSPEQKRMGLLLGSALGATEGVPIADLFQRMNVATGGNLAYAAKVGTIQAIEEAIQEGLQQIGENAVVKYLYGVAGQSLTEGAIEGMGAGGLVGFLTGFMLSGKVRMPAVIPKGGEEDKDRATGLPPDLTPPSVSKEKPSKIGDRINAEVRRLAEQFPPTLETQKGPPKLIKKTPSQAVPPPSLETQPVSPAQDVVPGAALPAPLPKTAVQEKPLAPAVFQGVQPGVPGVVDDFELYNLTEDIPGHPAGSTVARETIERAGYRVPERTEQTSGKEQEAQPTPEEIIQHRGYDLAGKPVPSDKREPLPPGLVQAPGLPAPPQLAEPSLKEDVQAQQQETVKQEVGKQVPTLEPETASTRDTYKGIPLDKPAAELTDEELATIQEPDGSPMTSRNRELGEYEKDPRFLRHLTKGEIGYQPTLPEHAQPVKLDYGAVRQFLKTGDLPPRGKEVQTIAEMYPKDWTEQAKIKNAGRFMTLFAGYGYSDLLHPQNKVSRGIFEKLTGKKLPKTVSGTQAMLQRDYKQIPYTLPHALQTGRDAVLPEKKPASQPKSIDMDIFFPTSKGYAHGAIQRIQAEPVPSIKEFQAAVHQTIDQEGKKEKGRWTVSEVTSGSAVASGATKEEAVRKAKEAIRGTLPEIIGAKIKQAVERTNKVREKLKEKEAAKAPPSLEPPKVTIREAELTPTRGGIKVTPLEPEPSQPVQALTDEVQDLKDRVAELEAKPVPALEPVAQPTKESTIPVPALEEGADVKRPPVKPLGQPDEGAPEAVQAEGVQAAPPERKPERPRTGDRPASGGGTEQSVESGPRLRPSLREDQESVVSKPGKVVVTVSEPSGHDYLITPDDRLDEGGPKAKFKKNLAAIKLLKKLDAAGRLATPDEQKILVKYTGWGGLKNAFTEDEHWTEEAKALKEVLTAEEYETARKSIQYAHYTDPKTIASIWTALKRLGLKRGSVLEPGMGTGNFFGATPADLVTSLQRSGVEMDQISGRIAKQLYQRANIQILPFQETTFPDNHFDVAVGNVPFSEVKIADPKDRVINNLSLSLHNYFFAKALKKVRPGGVVAFITSTGTMDNRHTRAREYFASQADLIAAYRLPSGTFKGIANTEVVTDIVILRKRKDGEESAGPAWTGLDELTKGDKTFRINEYFVANPSHILGTISTEGTMYRADSMTVEGDPAAAHAKLADLIEQLPEDVLTKAPIRSTTPASVGEALEAPLDVKPGAFFLQEDKLYTKVGDKLLPYEPRGELVKARIVGMVRLRDLVKSVIGKQLRGENEQAIADTQASLSRTYDNFVKKHGRINSRANRLAYDQDPDYPVLQSLEKNYDPKTEQAEKADIFTKRTIQNEKAITTADSPESALSVVLNESNVVDFDRMHELTGLPVGELQEALRGIVYQDPATKTWETATTYLSGNVREKLKIAKDAAKQDPTMAKNVEALEAVQPTDLLPSQIDARLGAGWIPPTDIKAFMTSLFNTRQGTVRYNQNQGLWSVEGYPGYGVEQRQTYGTSRVSGAELVEMGLNSQVPTVYDTERKTDKRVVNEQETLIAREKLDSIKEQFRKWIWEDQARATRLAAHYNEFFNNTVSPQFDGSHLRLPGKNPAITLRPKQLNAVYRGLQRNNTLFAHEVGTGKTFTLAALAMESRRLGLAKKPMIVVPNHLVEQWGSQFRTLYPASNLLLTSAKDFAKENRLRLMGRIATGDWDSVVVPFTSFTRLPVSKDTFREFMEQQIDILEGFIREERAASGNDRNQNRIVKDLEKAKERLSEKLKKRLAAKDVDDAVNFEETGVDMLLVDEADMFKNLFFPTRMQRISGLPNSESQRAYDMFLKTRYITKLNNGRGVVFATGTPISNSMAEVFTMQRYLQNDVLEQAGLGHFDAWARMFGEAVASIEMTASGKYKMKQRFANFINVPELMKMFLQVTDIVSADEAKVERPPMKSGKPFNVVSTPGPALKAYVAELDKRIDNLKNVDPSKDNMLKITGDGRHAALDVRLRVPGAPEDQDSKINKSVKQVAEIYQAWAPVKGTQLVFLDLSTPKGKSDKQDTKQAVQDDAENPLEEEEKEIWAETTDEVLEREGVYGMMRDKLIRLGVKREHIAFVHDAKTNKAKDQLFADVNAGNVRILFGSTEKMGAGTNVQQRAVALHNVDAPWRPRDIEQRIGRVWRFGNHLYRFSQALAKREAGTKLNDDEQKIYEQYKAHKDLLRDFHIQVYNYATEAPSFDVYMWQTLESKAKVIAQIMKGDPNIRTIQDVDATALNAAEMKAIASGNPMVLEKVGVDADVRKYSSLKSAYDDAQYSMKGQVIRAEAHIDFETKHKAKAKQELDWLEQHPGEVFKMKVGTQTYTKREEAGEALIKVMEQNPGGDFADLGATYRGLTLQGKRLKFIGYNGMGEQIEQIQYRLSASHDGGLTHEAQGETPSGIIRSLDHTLGQTEDIPAKSDRTIAEAKEKIEKLKKELEKPFEYEERLANLLARQKEIEKALSPSAEPQQATGTNEAEDEDTDEGEQAAGGEDQPSFQKRVPNVSPDRVTGPPSSADFARAFQTARPIGGESTLRLTDSSRQYPIGMIQDLAKRQHVHRLVKAVDRAYQSIKQTLVKTDEAFNSLTFAGFSPDDYYAGVNISGRTLFKTPIDNLMLLNPWAMVWRVEEAIKQGQIDREQADRYLASHLIDTIIHELTHQQVRTHEDEQKFEQQLDANYDKIGMSTLMRANDVIRTALKEQDHDVYPRLVSDLNDLTPFWRKSARLPLQARRSDAADRGARDGTNVAGEGTAGRTGPPEIVRSSGGDEASAMGRSPVFQRRESGERSNPPQYLAEAQRYRAQRATEEAGFSSSDPDIEARVRAAKQGLKPESLGTRLKAHAERVWRLVSREYENLPDTAEFSPLRTDLLRLQKYKGIAADKIQRDLAAIIKPLTRKQYDQLEWKALLSDLNREAEQDRALPFGYTTEKVRDDLDRLNAVIERDPVVQDAWNKRQALWDRLKSDYQRSMEAIGFDTSKKLTKEDYFRHQVLAYSQERTLKGTGSTIRTPTGRGFLKARQGSGLDINANYVQAEFEVMAQMVYDTQVAKVIKNVDRHYNIRRQLSAEARQRNKQSIQALIDAGGEMGAIIEKTMKDFKKRIGMHMGMIRKALEMDKDEPLTLEQVQEYANDMESPANLSARGVFKAIGERKAFVKEVLGPKHVTWEQLIPETHDFWQPREGNVFYMADSIPAQMAKALQEGMLQEINLTPDTLRKVMAMGNEREQYVIPKEAKATLEDLSHKEHSFFVEMNRSLLAHWKQLMLIAPRRVIRYNVRNLTGDADATFVGNPKAFAKYKQAATELIPVIFKDTVLTGEAKEWAERGGYGSTLQMQELGDLNDLKAFAKTLDREAKGGWLKLPASAWNRYWQAARLSTDYREAIGRYAAYLSFLDQMRANPQGRPESFGASKPETVMALRDIRDRAFKLSNELLGAYDRVGVAGQTLRSFWVPFWSWSEVNATRYLQLAKNAFDGQEAGTVARGAMIGAKQAATFLVKMAAFWSMLQVWNLMMYGDDEDELRETNPLVANRPHILFGRDEDGEIRYLAGIGALGDLLSWFGLDAFPGMVGDVMHDRMTIGEAVKNMAKAPVNKIVNAVTPTVKIPVEAVSRQSYYPDVFHPRPIQNRGDYLGQQTTFGPEIQALQGKPGKPLYESEDLTGLLVQRTDPKAAAYSTWQGIERKYMERAGKEDTSLFWRSPRGQALNNWSRAIHQADDDAITQWKDEYERMEREKYGRDFSLSKMYADMEKSLRAKAPLAGVTKAERKEIVAQLDSQERRTLAKAEAYYKDVLLQVLPPARRQGFERKMERQGWIQRPQVFPGLEP